MGFHIIYIYYHLTFILKEKGVTYALTIRPNFKTHIRPSFKWFNYAPNPTHICVNYFCYLRHHRLLQLAVVSVTLLR